MTLPRLIAAIALAGLIYLFRPAATLADDKSAADLLPPSTLVYAELTRPRELIGRLLDHPLWQRITAAPEYQQALQTPQYQQFQGVVTYLEQQLGVPWRQALETLTEGGVYVGLDAATEGVALLIKSSDAAMAKNLSDVLVGLARQHAKDQGQADPVEVGEYRGFTSYKTEKAGVVTMDKWLLVTNKPDLGKWVIDSYLDKGRSSLAAEPMYQKARGKAATGLEGWGYARIGTLRDVGVGQEVFSGKSDNAAGELLVGGILAALGKADYGTAELRAAGEELRLALVVPHDPWQVPAARKYFFAPAGEGSAPKPLMPEGTLLSLTTYRDIGAMWLAAPDLFDENVATQMAQADSALSQFFGGRSFSADVLGGIAPRMQFLAVRQPFKPGEAPVPAIKLPAMALVFQVKDAETMRPLMQVAFQTAVAIGNITATQQGAPTLMINTEKQGEVSLATASYLVGPEEKAMTEAPIYHNFTPSLALVGDYVILTSTRWLAEQLVPIAQQSASATVPENTLLVVEGPAILAALQDNRAQLVAQNMIQSGNSKEQAERAIDLLMEVVSQLQSADLKLVSDADQLRLEFGLKVRKAD